MDERRLHLVSPLAMSMPHVAVPGLVPDALGRVIYFFFLVEIGTSDWRVFFRRIVQRFFAAFI